MKDDERANMLLKLLTTAMIIHLFEQDKREEEDEDPSTMPGIVGGPERPGDPEPEPKERTESFGDVFKLNKTTDLVMRTLQAAVRFRLAKEMGMLHDDDTGDAVVEPTPFGITFNIKFKKDTTNEQMKYLEMGAELTQSYFHYRLFEKEPSIIQFIEGVDWKDGLADDELVEARQFMEPALQTIVPILHVHFDSIKSHGSDIFNQCIAHLAGLFDSHQKPDSGISIASLFGHKIIADIHVIKINSI